MPTPLMAAPLGCGGYTAPADAALLHGTAAHALDYDDTNHPAYAHPSAVLLPALLAVAPLTDATGADLVSARSEEHTSELQSLMRISYAVFCLKKKYTHANINT